MFLEYVLGHRKYLGAAEPSFIWYIFYNSDGFFCQKNVKYILFHHWMQKKRCINAKNGGRLKGKENES